jgi:hypothetical protein
MGFTLTLRNISITFRGGKAPVTEANDAAGAICAQCTGLPELFISPQSAMHPRCFVPVDCHRCPEMRDRRTRRAR